MDLHFRGKRKTKKTTTILWLCALFVSLHLKNRCLTGRGNLPSLLVELVVSFGCFSFVAWRGQGGFLDELVFLKLVLGVVGSVHCSAGMQRRNKNTFLLPYQGWVSGIEAVAN